MVRRRTKISRDVLGDVLFLEHSLGDFQGALHHDIFGDLLHDIVAREGDVHVRPAAPPATVPPILRPVIPDLVPELQ